jgi:hypothetical protein
VILIITSKQKKWLCNINKIAHVKCYLIPVSNKNVNETNLFNDRITASINNAKVANYQEKIHIKGALIASKK